MDADQIRKLKPMLTRYLEGFDDCFSRRETREHFSTYVEGQLSDLGEKSCEPIAVAARHSPAKLAGVSGGVQVGRRSGAGPPPGDGGPRGRRAQRGRHHRRNQRCEARRQNPGRATAMVRHRRQDGELHRHGSSGLRDGRFPLPVGRRPVSAGKLVGRPRAVPGGRHPGRRGLPAEMEDRPGASRSRPWQRRDVRLADVRRGIWRKTRVFAGIGGPRSKFSWPKCPRRLPAGSARRA